jgi:hypothetical protein
VNSDDHEETFAALTKSLRKSGDAHVALLRSRDLKARAGGEEAGGDRFARDVAGETVEAARER